MVLHDDCVIRHWKHTLDDIMAHSGPKLGRHAESEDSDKMVKTRTPEANEQATNTYTDNII
ncbi:hypothetical protein V5799_012743, partial [Amblyomma americanum]